MAVEFSSFKIQTKGNVDIINISKEINDIIFNTALRNGALTVAVAASTASIVTMEFEEGVEKDVKKIVNKLVPETLKYQHDKNMLEGNGVAHVRATLFGPSITIPFVNGKLALSVWQQIVLIDFDITPRLREITVNLIGE